MADVEANKECTVEWFEKKYHLRISEPVKAAGKKGKLKFGGGMSSDEVSAIASESEDNNRQWLLIELIYNEDLKELLKD